MHSMACERSVKSCSLPVLAVPWMFQGISFGTVGVCGPWPITSSRLRGVAEARSVGNETVMLSPTVALHRVVSLTRTSVELQFFKSKHFSIVL